MNTSNQFEPRDDNASSELKRLTGLWKKTKENGEEYLAGTLDDGRKILIFRNNFQDGSPDRPYYSLYIAPAAEKPAPKPEPSQGGFFGF